MLSLCNILTETSVHCMGICLWFLAILSLVRLCVLQIEHLRRNDVETKYSKFEMECTHLYVCVVCKMIVVSILGSSVVLVHG